MRPLRSTTEQPRTALRRHRAARALPRRAGAGQRRHGSGLPGRGPGAVYEPYLSPDGSMILYTQPVGTVGAYDIWVANADGSNPRNVT
ncbi:MAG: PD40 domain-containing protein, partial [Chloroflexi bacterium]|nr:PD40 domain-containing protein [Chloroflexota bacterium]